MTVNGQTVQAALAAVMADVREVRKTDQNTHQRFLFRGVDAVVNAVGPALRKHGVVVMPTAILSREVDRAQTKSGSINYITRLTIEYTFTGPAGDTMKSVVSAESMDVSDKGTAKAMSVALRTCLLQALCLPTDDTDPDAESHEESVNPEDEIRSRIEQATAQGPDAVQSLGTWAKGRWPDWALDELRKRLATMRGK